MTVSYASRDDLSFAGGRSSSSKAGWFCSCLLASMMFRGSRLTVTKLLFGIVDSGMTIAQDNRQKRCYGTVTIQRLQSKLQKWWQNPSGK